MNDDDLRAEIDRLLAMQDGLRAALADAVERLVAWDAVHDERDQLRIQVNRLVEENGRLQAENERMTETLRRLSVVPARVEHPCPRCGGRSRPMVGVEGYRSCDACQRAWPVKP